jgi:molybdopterin-binding protein
MKLASQNKLLGKVQQIKRGAVAAVVEIAVHASPTVTALVSLDEIDELGLQEGTEVTAIVKSTDVMLCLCGEGKGCK